MNIFSRFLHAARQSIQGSLSSASHQLTAVGAIAFIGFPLFYWIWTVWFPQPYETFALRMVGSLLGLGLILIPYWPAQLKRYLSLYWFVTIFYTLSFFFAFSFLMNQASVISAMSLLCSVFLLVLLVDLFSLTLLLIFGWSLAVVCYFLLSPYIYLGEEHVEMFLVILFVIVAGSTFNYKTAMIQQQRLAGMAAVAGMIAHELRTPLLGIKSGAQVLARYSPEVMSGYQIARDKGLIDSAIRNHRLQQLEGVSQRIVSETEYANTIIDMLLIKAGHEHSLNSAKLTLCSMAKCLKDAIERYPFKSKSEAALLRWRGDFNFIGSPLLMQHVLFNLIKNALYAIADAQKGEINIWTESDQKQHLLVFQDTAKGMSKAQLSKLFDHFYTTTFMGTGIGLSFCKMVMHRFGGDIHCTSELEQHTTFTLVFPRK